MKEITIWHNNQCGTSKKVLDFLIENRYQVCVRDYILNPPTIVELKSVLKLMNKSAVYILRKTDKVYKEKFIDKSYSDIEWIQAMSENPSIIQRPIIIINDKAYLGRPPDEFIANWEY